MKIVSFLIILFLGTSIQAFAQQGQELNVEQFDKESNKKGVVLVDVRTPQEYQAGHIKNAVNINFLAPDFNSNIQKLNKKARVLIYCRSGNRSGQAMRVLGTLGFVNYAELVGGTGAWQLSGKPLKQ